jgi:hypothetical protein
VEVSAHLRFRSIRVRVVPFQAMQTLINGCSKYNHEFQDKVCCSCVRAALPIFSAALCREQDSMGSAEFIQKLDPLVAEFWQQEIIDHITHLW